MVRSHSSSVTLSGGRGGGSGDPGCKCLITPSLATFPVVGGWGVPSGQQPFPASWAGLKALSTLKRSPWVGEGGPFLAVAAGAVLAAVKSFRLCWGRSIPPALPLAAQPGMHQSGVSRWPFIWGRRLWPLWLLQWHGGLFSAWVAFFADLLLLKLRYAGEDKSSGLSGMFSSDFELIPCFYYQSQTSDEFANRICSNKLFLFKGWFLFVCSTIQCFISCKSYVAFRDLGTIDLYSMY